MAKYYNIIVDMLYTSFITQENEDIQWASRWDYILSYVPQSKYQLIVSIYTISTVSFMSLYAGLIIYHSLRQDKKQTVRISL